MEQRHDLGQIQTTGLSLSLAMRQSLTVLRVSSRELFEMVAQEAERNPFLSLVPRAWQGGGEAPDAISNLSSDAPSLIDHVERQIGLAFRDAGDIRIAGHFVMALAETGWIDRDLPTIAFEAGCAESRAREILRRLQQFEPAGIFARSLAECLRIQAEELGEVGAALDAILDHLAEFAELGPRRFATRHRLEEAEVLLAAKTIRGFNPKPGLDFSFTPRPIFPPELIVRHEAERWQVGLNDEAFPDIRVDQNASPSELSAKAIRDGLSAARSLSEAVARRKTTLLAIAEHTMRTQIALLEHGVIAMSPLSLSDVADTIGVHVSTVSRAVSGCLVQTPRGTIPFRTFFSRGVRVAEDSDAAHAGIVELVRGIIQTEDPRHPLSDEAIQRQLAEFGFNITARSVNNHRRSLGYRRASYRRAE